MLRRLLCGAVLFSIGLSARGQQLQTRIPAPEAVRFAVFSADGTRVAAATVKNRVVAWTLPDAKMRQSWEFGEDRPRALSFLPDGKSLLVGLRSGAVQVRDFGSGEVTRTIATGHAPDVLAVSRDSRWLAETGNDAKIQIWDLHTGRRQSVFSPEFGGTESLAFSPDGTILASSGDDANVYVWEAATGKHGKTIVELSLMSPSVDFSADGKRLIVGNNDGAIHVFEMPSGSLLRSYSVQKFPAANVRVSPDGQKAAAFYTNADSGRSPAPVILWNLIDGTILQRTDSTSFNVNGGVFTSDGRVLFMTASGSDLLAWSLE